MLVYIVEQRRYLPDIGYEISLCVKCVAVFSDKQKLQEWMDDRSEEMNNDRTWYFCVRAVDLDNPDIHPSAKLYYFDAYGKGILREQILIATGQSPVPPNFQLTPDTSLLPHVGPYPNVPKK